MDRAMSTLSAGTTLTTALVATGDTSGELIFKTNTNTTAMTFDTSGNGAITGDLTINNGAAVSTIGKAIAIAIVFKG